MANSDPDAVAALCQDCRREFYVTDEPVSCPRCGGEEVGCKYRTANAKLHLEEGGEVKARKVRNAYLWELESAEGSS